MNTRERAIYLIDSMSESELEGFVKMLSRVYNAPEKNPLPSAEEIYKELSEVLPEVTKDFFENGRNDHIHTVREGL